MRESEPPTPGAGTQTGREKSQTMEFKGSNVLVTGATRGIGRGIALAFAAEGACVAINGTRSDLAERVAEEVGKAGGEGLAVPGDVSRSEDVLRIFRRIREVWGEIDVLVNCAGIIFVADCVETTDEQWDRTMEVNCRGAFLCCREALRGMIRRKSGCIVNISSQLGKTAAARYSHYCASKFAVIGFTQAIAREVASLGIRVNAVCPGAAETDMMAGELEVLVKLTGKTSAQLGQEFRDAIPLGRYAEPGDIAPVVLFLASRRASYMTGQALNATGGAEVH